MSALLNTASMLMCPHGGTVSAISSNARVSAAGAPLVRTSDTFVIAGCPFSTPAGPHPCVLVQWVTQDLRSQVLSGPTLSEASVGLCLAADQAPQGAVIIAMTQPQVAGE